MHIVPPLFLFPVLLAPLPAQDTAAADVAPLVVKTTQERFAMRLAGRGGRELPELKAGEHYVLTLGEDGEFTAAAGNGAVPFVFLEAKPRVLMEMFAEQVDQARDMGKMGAAMASANSPFKPKQMEKLIDAVFDFPRQVETFTVTVDGDSQKGWDAHAELVPLAGSGFATGVGKLRASGKGAPRLGEGIITMAADLAPGVVEDVFASLSEFVVGMVAEADRPAARKMIATQFAACDGSMALVMGEDWMRMALGCRDAAAMRELMASDDWARLQKSFLAAMPEAEVAVKREKVGDLDVVHVVGDLGTTDNPFAKDGKIDSWSAVVGDQVVSVVNGGRKAFEELAQRATAGGLELAALPEASVLTMNMRLADFLAMSGQDIPDGMPDSIDLRLGKKGKDVLVVDVRVGM